MGDYLSHLGRSHLLDECVSTNLSTGLLEKRSKIDRTFSTIVAVILLLRSKSTLGGSEKTLMKKVVILTTETM